MRYMRSLLPSEHSTSSRLSCSSIPQARLSLNVYAALAFVVEFA